MLSVAVSSLLDQYRQVLVAGHDEVTGDPAGLDDGARRARATAALVAGAGAHLGGARTVLAEAWRAPSREPFDRTADGFAPDLAAARSTLDRQANAMEHAAAALRTADTRFTDLRARFDRSASVLVALARTATNGDAARMLSETSRVGRGYAGEAAVIRRDLAARLTEVAAILGAAAQPAAKRVGSMNLAEINEILAHPERHSFATVAAAYARKDLLEHQEAYDLSNPHVGTIRGNRSGTSEGRPSDCTEYVVDIMRRTYAAKAYGAPLTFVRDANGRITDILGPGGEHLGRERTFEAILREAAQRSGRDGLKGTELLAAMQRRAGWGGVFWAPDPDDPFDGDNHHRTVYRTAQRTGDYYGITVDKDDMVVNYTRTHPTASHPTETTGITKLREVPFGLLVARGGTHMAAVVNGEVYEVHWDRSARDRTAIEATPLERFGDPADPWQSGAIAAPRPDLVQAGLNDPPPRRRR